MTISSVRRRRDRAATHDSDCSMNARAEGRPCGCAPRAVTAAGRTVDRSGPARGFRIDARGGSRTSVVASSSGDMKRERQRFRILSRLARAPVRRARRRPTHIDRRHSKRAVVARSRAARPDSYPEAGAGRSRHGSPVRAGGYRTRETEAHRSVVRTGSHRAPRGPRARRPRSIRAVRETDTACCRSRCASPSG